jgi:hypothetical protein
MAFSINLQQADNDARVMQGLTRLATSPSAMRYVKKRDFVEDWVV